MARNFFDNLPSTRTPVEAGRMNALLDGDEAMGNIVVDSIRGKNLFNINGDVNVKGNDATVHGTGNTVSGNVLTSNYNSANSHGFGQRFTNLNGKTITVSAKVVSNGTGTGGHLIIYDNNSSVEDITITSGNTNYITYTCTSNNVVVAFSTATGTGAQYTDIQIEIGSSKTDYAPYQGLSLGYVSGQNSNGSYVKYDDGRLECYGIVPISYTANTWSNVEKNYPYTFTQINSAVISVLESGNRKIFTNWTSSETKIKIIYTADVSGSSQCSYIAIGRWK